MPGAALLDLVYGSDKRDRSFMRKGLCRRSHPTVDNPTAWSCAEKTRVVIAGVEVPAMKAHEMAAMICFSCPVQWSCTRFALEGEESGCVWGMTPRDMKRLRDTSAVNGLDPIALVDAAEALAQPVQVMVQRLCASV